MSSGPLPHPKRKLDPRLRDLTRVFMRDQAPGSALALYAGFPHQCQLSDVLHARRVPATPLNVRRLQLVAKAVGFEGDLFLPEEA